jgi:hypothetical protein
MPSAAIAAYAERLPARHAEMQFLLAQVMLLPYTEPRVRSEILKAWQRSAESARQPGEKENAGISPEALAHLGLAVEVIPMAEPTEHEA